MEASTLELARDGDWLTVWLNRPASRNALSAEMAAELLQALEAAAPDRTLRGVTLRGRGGVFCAGGDLKAFRALAAGGTVQRDEVVQQNLDAGALFERVNTLPQVVVVLVEGAAMAGGLGLACCADLVAVTGAAQFALTETTLGIPPAQIAPLVAARIGLPAARRLMLTAARFGGDEARSLGLADCVVDDAAALDAWEAQVRAQVRGCAAGANAATKEILLAGRRLSGEHLRHYAAERFADCLVGPEGREGLQAFIEKRRPAWTLPAREDEA